MLTETTGRTPQDLATELREALAVDWLQAWRRLPDLGPELTRWFEKYGWEPSVPIHERGGIDVRTRTGAGLYISVGIGWNVLSVGYTAWNVRAGDASENGALLARTAEAWPVHLKAAQSVLGAPTWDGSWDADDFPEPPHPSYWADRAYRLERRSPEALAYWKPSGGDPGRPHIVLHQVVSNGARTTTEPGQSLLYLDLYAPSEFLNTRR